jgi:hypothetical protein
LWCASGEEVGNLKFSVRRACPTISCRFYS